MFKELNKNEMMDFVGGGYPVGVPVYGADDQYLGIKMVSSDSGIKCYVTLRKYWDPIPCYEDYVPHRGH